MDTGPQRRARRGASPRPARMVEGALDRIARGGPETAGCRFRKKPRFAAGFPSDGAKTLPITTRGRRGLPLWQKKYLIRPSRVAARRSVSPRLSQAVMSGPYPRESGAGSPRSRFSTSRHSGSRSHSTQICDGLPDSGVSRSTTDSPSARPRADGILTPPHLSFRDALPPPPGP
jgi:hypothetical protein